MNFDVDLFSKERGLDDATVKADCCGAIIVKKSLGYKVVGIPVNVAVLDVDCGLRVGKIIDLHTGNIYDRMNSNICLCIQNAPHHTDPTFILHYHQFT